MPSHEDLYQEMERREDEESHRYRMERIHPARPVMRELDAKKAIENYERDFKPVIEAQKRAMAGKPITDNWMKNLLLWASGKDKLEMPEVVQPTVDPVILGKNAEETRLEIIEHVEANKHLRRQRAEAKPVSATRKTPQDLRGDR